MEIRDKDHLFELFTEYVHLTNDKAHNTKRAQIIGITSRDVEVAPGANVRIPKDQILQTAREPIASASAFAPISSKISRIRESLRSRPTLPPRSWRSPSSFCASFGIAACRCA